MIRLPIRALAVLVATCITAAPTFAKDPSVFVSPSFTPATMTTFGSLTPPPKEWAMFPQEEPPAAAPQNSQAPVQPNSATAPGTSAQSGHYTGGIVSAANAHTAPRRELPLFWLMVTGALSLGAITACGSLILRKDASLESSADEIPVVSELQEIKA
jgi:hypothetical protein